jgi:hypothetical protein
MEVRFDGEPKIRCLYPESLSHALNFGSHAALVLKRKQVLDHGITKNDIYAAVIKPGKVRRITRDRLDILMSLFLCGKIQSQNFHIVAFVPAPILPKRVRTAYIENTKRPWQVFG